MCLYLVKIHYYFNLLSQIRAPKLGKEHLWRLAYASLKLFKVCFANCSVSRFFDALIKPKVTSLFIMFNLSQFQGQDKYFEKNNFI